jgi:hypothetical protein
MCMSEQERRRAAEACRQAVWQEFESPGQIEGCDEAATVASAHYDTAKIF